MFIEMIAKTNNDHNGTWHNRFGATTPPFLVVCPCNYLATSYFKLAVVETRRNVDALRRFGAQEYRCEERRLSRRQ